MTAHGWRDVLFYFVTVAAFPRLARTAWARRGPRAVVAWVAFNTALGFAVRTWLVPHFKRAIDVREELRRQLGREPADIEVMDRLRVT
jgi:hypothetical protein